MRRRAPSFERVADLAADLRPSDVNRFNALLRGMGLEELAIPRPVQPNLEGSQAFVLLIVLFILLVIIGASFRYHDTE